MTKLKDYSTHDMIAELQRRGLFKEIDLDKYEVKLEQVILTVSDCFSVEPRFVKGSRRRSARYCNARHACITIMRGFLDMTYEEIGDYFNRDHATVMASCQRVRLWQEVSEVRGYAKNNARLQESIKVLVKSGLLTEVDMIHLEAKVDAAS